MRNPILTVFGLSLLVAFVAFVLFIAYYLMLWPFQPRLEVDDAVISKWLRQDGVVIYRQGEELSNSRMYITKGERIKGSCSWHIKSTGSDERTIVSREVATDLNTCESLIEEGSPIE